MVMTRLLAISLLAAVAGCTMAPQYVRPESPVDGAYPSFGRANEKANSKEPQEVAAADIGWRDFFSDPLLQQLIERSLENNRDLRVAALNVEAARAKYRIQRSELLPNLSATGSGDIRRAPADVSATGQADVRRVYQVAGVTAAWEVDLWGRIRSLSDQALAEYMALDETRLATQMSLVAEVANAYIVLRADQELLRLTNDTLASRQRSFDLTKELVEAGSATELDLRQSEIALRSAEASQALYTRLAALDLNAVVLLIGQPLTPEMAAQLENANTLPDGIVPASLPSGLPSDLLARRPDIRAAESVLKGANANIGAARAAFFPAITLTGSGGTASASLGGLFDAGSQAWTFLPQISVPIFRGGALSANLDLAHVQKRIEIANYEKAIQVSFREVSDGLAGERTFDDQIRAESQLVSASEKTFDLARKRFDEGIDDYLAVLDAQRTLYGSQQALVRTRMNRLNNIINLYKALGGGWTEQTARAESRTAERSTTAS